MNLTRNRLLLLGIIIIANLGVAVFNRARPAMDAALKETRPPGTAEPQTPGTEPGQDKGMLGFIIWNAVLFIVVLKVDRFVRNAVEERRRLERKYNKLELRVGDTRPEAEVLETISEISVEFLERMHLMPLLQRISAAARRTLNADVCALEIFSDSYEPISMFVDGTDHLVFGAEVYRRVREHGSSILINNVANHPQYVAMAEQNLTGMMVAPFELRGKVIGLIGVFSRQEGNFTGRELRLLHIFAHHGALLIETTRLMEAVRHLSLKSRQDEVADLAHLRERLALERDLENYEMGIAHRIQSDLLPKHLPDIPGLKLEAVNRPAKEVGGDFYDVIELDEDKWGIVIGDVSGKGVPAALVTVMSQTVLHMLASAEASPSRVLCRLNDMLYRETPSGMFVSMWYGVWDRTSRILNYANGGFEHPLWFIRNRNTCRLIESEGLALGVMEDISDAVSDKEIRLEPGDILLLYTDGVIEAKDNSNRMFGIERLQQEIVEIGRRSRNGCMDILVKDIDAFVAGAEQHDDITMLSLAVSHVEQAAAG